jgi:hypothetical protein
VARLCAVGFALVLVPVTFSGAPLDAQSADGVSDRFVDELGGCPPEATLLVTVLSDETDVFRLDVVADLVRQLSNLPDRAVEMLVARAAPDFTPIAPREAATPASADRLAEYLRQGAGSDGDDAVLSLPAGVEGAAIELAERAAVLDTGGGSCSLLVVVSGGEIDVDEQGDLCAAGGPSSQISDVPASVWVTSPTVEEDETELLVAVASGCDPMPDDPAGRYLATDGATGLAAETARLAAVISGAASVQDELQVCAAEQCAEGRYDLVIDPVFGRFAATVTLPSDRSRLIVSLPRGVVFPLDDRVGGPINAGSFTIQTTWVTPGVVRLDATVSPADDDWAGVWGFVVVEPDVEPDETGTAGLVVAAAPGVTPRLIGSTRLIAGQRVTLSLELVDDVDRLVSGPTIIEAAAVRGIVRTPDGGRLVETEFEPDEQGQWRGRFALDAGVDPDAGPYSLDVVVQTTSSLVDLPDVVVTQQITVLPASSWPTLTTTSLVLNGSAGASALGSVTVVGGTDADGCVWLVGTSGLGDAAARLANDARSAASCILVPAGQTLTIPLVVELDGLETGRYDGTAILAIGVAGDDASDTLELPVVLQVTLPVDTVTRVLITAAMTLAAVVLPLVALWLLDWVRAKFRPGRNAVTTDVWISVWADGSMYRVDADGAPLLFSNDSFKATEFPRARRFGWRDLEFGVRNARSPLSPPVGTVWSPEGPTVASGGVIVDEASVVGRVPLNLADTWIFVLQPEATRDAALDPRAPDFFAAYGRLILVRSSLDSQPIDLSALPGMAQRLARTVRSARDAGVGTAQEMLDFVDANAAAPRDLPRRHHEAAEDGDLPAAPSRQLPSGDLYDFSDLGDLFDPDEDAATDEDLIDDTATDEVGLGEDTVDGGLGIVFEREVNPSAFLIESSTFDDDHSDSDSADTETTDPTDPEIGWARRSKPSWPVPGRRKDP